VNDNCVACNACTEACPSERVNEFNFGMDRTKAAYLPYNQAFPQKYVIDDAQCTGDCGKACQAACKYDAIDLTMKAETLNLKFDAIIVATGWKPYDAAKTDNLGFGKVKNVINNMMMERLASPNGPTAGKILRPSDGKPGPERRLCAVCRQQRRESSRILLIYLLHGLSETDSLPQGAEPGIHSKYLLHRYQDARPVRGNSTGRLRMIQRLPW